MHGWRREMPVPTTETGQFLNFLLHLCNFLVSPNQQVSEKCIHCCSYHLPAWWELNYLFCVFLSKNTKNWLSPITKGNFSCNLQISCMTFHSKKGWGWILNSVFHLYLTQICWFSWTTISLLRLIKSRKGLQSQVAVRLEYLMLLFFLFLYWQGLHADTC